MALRAAPDGDDAAATVPAKRMCTAAPASRPSLRFASICSSNMNRSMEAHLQLQLAGLNVESYGTGSHVKLPGPSADQPNVYNFGTPYADILSDLKSKDEALYIQNGVLAMLERNVKIKHAPQPWKAAMQAASSASENDADVSSDGFIEGQFDVIITFEERVFDAVFDSFQERECAEFSEKAVHCINVEVKDSHEEALRGAQDALALCKALNEATDLDDQVGEIVTKWAEGVGARDGSARIKTYVHTFYY